MHEKNLKKEFQEDRKVNCLSRLTQQELGLNMIQHQLTQIAVQSQYARGHIFATS